MSYTRLPTVTPPFKRRSMQLGSEGDLTPQPAPPTALPSEDCTVLVVNASHQMAKEITMELALQIPGCSIVYSPSIEIAKLMLSRRRINLVVSSPILPDGSVEKLRGVLEKLENAPDVVVVGAMSARNAELFTEGGYEFSSMRRIGRPSEASGPVINRRGQPPIDRTIKDLGADIRNDLNNPLQEIVAMVFVAQAGHTVSPATEQALKAIDQAAKNMAKVVNRLEDKIRDAVVTR
ncbi:MAG: hypothetical protein RL417_585 [Pseudomonadota bacterium]